MEQVSRACCSPCEAKTSRKSYLLNSVDCPSAYVGFSMTRPCCYRSVSVDVVVLKIHRCHGFTGFTLHRKAYPHSCATLSVVSPACIIFLLHERGIAGVVPENRQADY